MRYIYGYGRGLVRFNYQSKTLFIKDLYNCRIDLNFIKQNAGEIDKLVLYKVDKTAQLFNFSKEKLPFIKECIFVNNQICKDYTNGILTFDKVYSSKSNIIKYN